MNVKSLTWHKYHSYTKSYAKITACCTFKLSIGIFSASPPLNMKVEVEQREILHSKIFGKVVTNWLPSVLSPCSPAIISMFTVRINIWSQMSLKWYRSMYLYLTDMFLIHWRVHMSPGRLPQMKKGEQCIQACKFYFYRYPSTQWFGYESPGCFKRIPGRWRYCSATRIQREQPGTCQQQKCLPVWGNENLQTETQNFWSRSKCSKESRTWGV